MANELQPSSPAALPALSLDRPGSVLSLPPWLIERLAALSPWDEGTTKDGKHVPTIPASLKLTGPMRAAIERRHQDLILAGFPGPVDEIEMQVGDLVARYANAKTDEISAGIRIEWYMDALSDQPAWAVKEAIRRWRRGECGPQKYDFPPSEALLRQIVEGIAAVARGQHISLRRLLDAEPVEPMSLEDMAASRARVARDMDGFLAGRRITAEEGAPGARTVMTPEVRPAFPQPTWTCELVGELLIEAFRKRPNTPIHGPPPGARQTAFRHDRPEEFDLVALSTHCLGRDSQERLFLLTWARAKATGASIHEICRERGWPRETFKRRRMAACRRIVDRLNRDRIPAP